MTDELRAKDVAVLQAIQEGASTTSEIREATTLTNREINYSLTEYSLEERGLVDINRRKGRQEDETGKTIWTPKGVSLTDHGLQTLAQLPSGDKQYEAMNQRELIEEVQSLEERLDRLETVFKDFRQTVMRRL